MSLITNRESMKLSNAASKKKKDVKKVGGAKGPLSKEQIIYYKGFKVGRSVEVVNDYEII